MVGNKYSGFGLVVPHNSAVPGKPGSLQNLSEPQATPNEQNPNVVNLARLCKVKHILMKSSSVVIGLAYSNSTYELEKYLLGEPCFSIKGTS